ncbi:hypothetical protein EJ066_03095 [Mesorhizobium sp. M9A.F.Ca.ET.002.03.1.2]|uniref:hypothetical protein n=1 Tax=Mesorhizobium sp. M9A.F.Ca.ET.002.03.1.2 TaxID=2493668 RepID=UPI000F7645E6|nr:hypothetical protein [Mesorhizobium sp. M9A.F.Ca.ET.002.03.1.2]AZN96362.1 hypothetical protein EJ066_03095 [Mesorhizobium sp. M9A.F.Ca.ET.002.03.1.2]
MLVLRRTPLLVAICSIGALPSVAAAESSYVYCDNGLRCVMAPCPSNSALDLATGKIIKGVSIDIDGLPQEEKALGLSDKLYAGKVVVAGSIENQTQTLNGKQYTLPWLVAAGIERASRDSERGHCSSH